MLAVHTSRGTPSGSPTLITVCSCFEREEPVWQSVAYQLNSIHECWEVLSRLKESRFPRIHCSGIKNRKNSLNKLGLRLCPYFAFGVVVAEADCRCCGVCGELEYDEDELELAAAAALLLSPYEVRVGIVIDDDIAGL